MVEKTIDLTGISANSVEEAVQLAISRAGVTINGIHTAHVQNIDAIVESNKVVRWKVNVKVTFQVKDELQSGGAQGLPVMRNQPLRVVDGENS
jgi:flavin-binding protein dodecin